jgi:hypothetical protein
MSGFAAPCRALAAIKRIKPRSPDQPAIKGILVRPVRPERLR